MIHIILNANGSFDVATVADNGELLNRSTQGFERKQGCYTNIRSSARKHGNRTTGIMVQDDSVNPSRMIEMHPGDSIVMHRKELIPGKPYQTK